MNIHQYLRVYRIDHWIKNIFTLFGSLGAIFINNQSRTAEVYSYALFAFLLSCTVSSVNYVINELLDASFDAIHPIKKHRPIPSGKVNIYKLLVSALTILAITFIVSLNIFNKKFNLSLLSLFCAGLLYNVRPLRLKDIPFIDVVSESVNNPIRLFIGWYAVGTALNHPPYALIAFFWTVGAFLMTAKRIAELKLLKKHHGTLYRPTFKYYTNLNLTSAYLIYAVLSIIFFIISASTHQYALYYSLPPYIIFILWYIKLTYEENSVVIDPEHIYKRPFFCAYIFVCCIFTFLALLFNG